MSDIGMAQLYSVFYYGEVAYGRIWVVTSGGRQGR
jgi:hypothetical protein